MRVRKPGCDIKNVFCFSRANRKSTNLKKKVFELKIDNFTLFTHFPRWLRLGQSLQTCCTVNFCLLKLSF